MNWRFAIILLPLIGCDSLTVSLPVSEPESEQPAFASQFDTTCCGTLNGTVVWQGLRPDITPLTRQIDNVHYESVNNPNAIAIERETSGVRDAIVMLRGIVPSKAKPWDHPSVSVELTADGISILQSTARSRSGFVRLGEVVRFSSTTTALLGVRGRGDSHFAHVLSPKAPCVERAFTRTGRVELTSTTGQFWASADLFVVDHPYIARTDDQGRYRFEQVPAGEYAITAYHPNWRIAEKEIDPNTSLPVRARYGPPLEAKASAAIRRGEETTSPPLIFRQD